MGEVDNSKRSYNMSKIKGKDTKPELIVRKILYKTAIDIGFIAQKLLVNRI